MRSKVPVPVNLTILFREINIMYYFPWDAIGIPRLKFGWVYFLDQQIAQPANRTA